MTVLDISNFDSDIIGNGACLKLAGIEGVIVGCQRPSVAKQQIATLNSAGVPVLGVYAFLYFGLDSTGQTAAAIDVAKAHGIQRVWLDCESTGEHERAGITPDERIAELRNCIAMVRQWGLEPGIYTGGWYWPHQMANTAEFSDLPLWHSAYLNGEATPYEVREVDYGGWSRVAVHQWTSTYFVCGRCRDANHYFLEEEMTDEEFRKRFEAEFERRMGQLFPAYIEAYYSKGFTARNAQIDPGEVADSGPIRPWLEDIKQTTCGGHQ